jgi:hypothetical protein
MINLFKFDKKIKYCHLFFPENASEISSSLSASISAEFKIECNCINYKSKLSPECVNKILQELNTNGIFLIAYREKISPENCYKLGLVNAHNKPIILINLTTEKNHFIPKYILNYVKFRLQLKLIKRSDQKLEIDKDELHLFLLPLSKLLNLFINNNIDSILYQKAIEYCHDLEREKGLHSRIKKIDEKNFSRKMSEGGTRKRLRHYYLNNDQDLRKALLNLVAVDKSEIFLIQSLPDKISSENNYHGDVAKKQNRGDNATTINVHGNMYGNINSQNTQEGQPIMEENKPQYVINQTGNFGIGQMSGGEIQAGAKVGGIINESQQKSLAEVAKEIQELLNQLSQTYPTAEVVGKAIDIIEENPSFKSKIIKVLKAVGTESFKEAVDHPLANILMAGVEAWTE